MHDVQNRERTARRAGMRPGALDDLKGIERRRLQVWSLMAVLLLAVSVIVALSILVPELEQVAIVDRGTLSLAMIGLSASFTAYVFEKEFALRRLTRIVIGEREQRIRLDAQARRIHGIVEEAQALRAPLDLDRLLHTALGCAIDLVGASGAAISVVNAGRLDLRRVRGSGVEAAVRAGRIAEDVLSTGAASRVVADLADGYELPGLAVPIRHGEHPLGVLDVRFAAPVELDSPQASSLVALAEHIATALHHATRYVETHENDPNSRNGVWSELQALIRTSDPQPQQADTSRLTNS